ncbi:hypothetical protein A2803_02035 [Candidatus Woesebacteria bacterium RIFCSPHIGHO2_01_FULL_44_21]|uniref:Ceramidase n=1 Tax=Candidatus Woesebacteria bacterium RIFCSPHIGHO2_01_FULL_44_21 TaxID=1802503 RepID=A0A1F7Z0W6_9BACT|nr:MAG: hypothetical protein A2803_02035 [Candidatus Woesebacteria bacterium RIFCSPHIGHO2_01_FULL_44_21]OGM71041.1 MAG: hypothetical protein A2897_03555 [Candidatus Woesebacteria bacterium RIFCSPLOWO2_01_FULL_44_24b]
MLHFYEANIKGPVAQPSNTATALPYFIVGLAILNHDANIALAVFFVGVTTIYFHARCTILGQYVDILSIIILAAVFFLKAYPFNQLNQINFIIGILLIVIAEVFWIIDIKHVKFIPKNHILTGHGVWHILTAISVWFFYMSLAKST